MSAANHYDCPVTHPKRKGRPSPGNHRPGCPVSEGHTEGTPAGPGCKQCMHEYQLSHYLRKGRIPNRNPNHPHYNCSLPPEAHPVMRGVGRDHRAGCEVAEGHKPGVPAGSRLGCPACKRIINRKSYRPSVLRTRYGMSVSEYDRLFSEQDGKCAICGKAQDAKLAVDHNHQTGRNRGLLCKKCNLGLGYFYDSIPALRAAIDYLSR